MEDDAPMTPDDALALAHATRSSLAARAGTPRWYAPGYGLGCGAMIASFALPGSWMILGTAASTLWVLGLYALWRRQSGLSVSGYRAGATLPVTIGLLIAFVIAVGAAVWSRAISPWGPVGVGAVLGVIAALASAQWDRVWRREMARL